MFALPRERLRRAVGINKAVSYRRNSDFQGEQFSRNVCEFAKTNILADLTVILLIRRILKQET